MGGIQAAGSILVAGLQVPALLDSRRLQPELGLGHVVNREDLVNHPGQRRVGKQVFGAVASVPTADVAMVSAKPYLLDVPVLGHVSVVPEQGRPEFQSPLVDGDRVADVFSWGLHSQISSLTSCPLAVLG